MAIKKRVLRGRDPQQYFSATKRETTYRGGVVFRDD